MTGLQVRTPVTADLLRGAVELEPTDHGLLLHRLPSWARAHAIGERFAGHPLLR